MYIFCLTGIISNIFSLKCLHSFQFFLFDSQPRRQVLHHQKTCLQHGSPAPRFDLLPITTADILQKGSFKNRRNIFDK